ncbi:MAG: ATP-binding protein [Proteobacteria bacterium]|nr:ATP-binding protein [Pseudomonadota bacterium]
MKKLDDVIRDRREDGEERLLEVARFAEQGMSAAAIIHEIRQPLTALSMALQMALDISQTCHPEMQDIVKEAIRLSGRAELLLERGRDFMTPHKERVEIQILDAVDRVMSMFHWHVRTVENISIRQHLPADLPHIFGDRGQIEQAIGNLLSNAIDALSNNGGGTIHVVARSTAQQRIEIIVADDGVGIPPDARAQVFAPFFSTKPRMQGTGLGLYLVRHMARAHGGDARLLTDEELQQLALGPLSTGILIALAQGMPSGSEGEGR